MSDRKKAMPGGDTVHGRELPAGLPHVACILLWYPLFTQPFIFREIEGLKERLPLSVYSLYGRDTRHCSAEMLAQADCVRTFGVKALPGILAEMLCHCSHGIANVKRMDNKMVFRDHGSVQFSCFF